MMDTCKSHPTDDLLWAYYVVGSLADEGKLSRAEAMNLDASLCHEQDTAGGQE